MRTLTKIAADKSNGQEVSFMVDVGTRKTPVTCVLYQGYDKKDDGVYWGLNAGSCIKSHYTAADRAEVVRLDREGAIKNGDLVMIDGETYKARVLGAFSNAVVFDKQ